MSKYTVLYLSDNSSGSIARGLRNDGCQLLVAETAAQAVAYLFINRRIDAVVIDWPSQPLASLDVAQALRSVRPEVPILLVSLEAVQPLPRSVDACLSGEHRLETLLLTLDLLLGPATNNLAPSPAWALADQRSAT